VNENYGMVKYLLSNGADVHQRCCGKFFLPEDQKNARRVLLNSDAPTLPVETNYAGYFYYGEYPLSYAALLNQNDCVRLLIAYGADLNMQDSNGNAVLHMLVINNNLVS
jgi:transient receptor potential cation channel subfamily V member 5